MKIYLSYSYKDSIPFDTVEDLVKAHKCELTYSLRTEPYDASKMQKADAVVFALPNLTWKIHMDYLTSGVLSELMWCINSKKPLYMLYKSAVGLAIYKAVITEDLEICGVSGSGNTIFTVGKLKSYTDLSNYQIGENLDMDIEEELDASYYTELKSYTY